MLFESSVVSGFLQGSLQVPIIETFMFIGLEEPGRYDV